MKVGELSLEQDMVVVGPADVARAARPRAALVERRMHRIEHDGGLAHAEIVVRAPDGDILDRAVDVTLGLGEGPALPLEVGEYAIGPFAAQGVELVLEQCVVVHGTTPIRNLI